MFKDKLAYEKPALTIYGNLKDVTAGTEGSGFESNSKKPP
jgi:hypothetical protein